jgi:hypothetical protein
MLLLSVLLEEQQEAAARVGDQWAVVAAQQYQRLTSVSVVVLAAPVVPRLAVRHAVWQLRRWVPSQRRAASRCGRLLCSRSTAALQVKHRCR